MAASHDSLPAARRRSKRRRFWWSLTLSISLFLVLGVWGLVFLASDHFAISHVEVRGTRLLSPTALAATARAVMAEPVFPFITGDRYWFLPQAALTNELTNRFSRLAAVSITKLDWHTVELKVSERETWGLWCPAEVDSTSDCLYLDGSGIAFAYAPRFSHPPLIVFKSHNLARLIGGQPLPRSVFNSIFNLGPELESILQTNFRQDLALDQVVITEDNDYELHFARRYSGVDSFKVMTTASGLATLAAQLTAALESAAFQSDLKRGHPLEYLDLRFDAKVFYRFHE
ncbi:MAG: hypothetical protein AAB455_02525 [Patescibacteria group bacterium]